MRIDGDRLVNPSADKTRPIIRLVGLIASVLAFAFVWSGDQKVQAEIAAARAKTVLFMQAQLCCNWLRPFACSSTKRWRLDRRVCPQASTS